MHLCAPWYEVVAVKTLYHWTRHNRHCHRNCCRAHQVHMCAVLWHRWSASLQRILHPGRVPPLLYVLWPVEVSQQPLLRRQEPLSMHQQR